MPKLPRDVSHQRLVRFLHAHGFVLVRQGGKHTVVSRGDLFVAVPRHTILKTGTVHAILKASGVARRHWGRL